ncbi:MAG: PLDc_N domain-containing protein [Candidatus Cloacimonetes bacterium]|nr:PLDc_N domain-containing protein [Candidatus Cloacimonadota bacterium]
MLASTIGWPHLLVLLVAIALIALFVVAIVSIAKSPASGVEKAIWVLITLLFPVVGPIVWFIVGANRRGTFE